MRKGEKSAQVVYSDKIVKEEESDDGQTIESCIPSLKVCNVFNADQIDGLPQSFYYQAELKIANPDRRGEALDLFFADTMADIYTGTEAACFIKTDRIEIPAFETFARVSDFYGT